MIFPISDNFDLVAVIVLRDEFYHITPGLQAWRILVSFLDMKDQLWEKQSPRFYIKNNKIRFLFHFSREFSYARHQLTIFCRLRIEF